MNPVDTALRVTTLRKPDAGKPVEVPTPTDWGIV